MVKNKVLKAIMSLLLICLLLAMNVCSVSAHEIKDNEITILNSIEEIELYNSADGTYEIRLEDGSYIQITIKTTNIINPKISTYATETIQNKTYTYRYLTLDKDLDWESKITGTFHYNNTYVWCTAGIANYAFGDSDNSSISYSLNTYSSAKVTGVSKYQIEAKITTPTGTYNISQSIGSDPTGQAYTDIIF